MWAGILAGGARNNVVTGGNNVFIGFYGANKSRYYAGANVVGSTP